MSPAVKLALLASGIFLFVALVGGVLKYRGIMRSENRRAPYYIDIAHRAALMYSFAALVMAELLKYSPYSETFQIVITAVPLFFFAVSIAQYFKLGIENKTNNQFKKHNVFMKLNMWLLVVGELGGVGFIVLGFIQSQII
jgi:hypothetical protein